MSKAITVVESVNNGIYKDMLEIVYTPKIGDKKLNAICDTEDVAILVALGQKYEGPNSRFATMACRMLKINSVWAE